MDTAPLHSLHLLDWARTMRADVDAARVSIALSALSLQPPRSKSPGDWPRLWNALCEAAARKVDVTLYVPQPTPTHPATRFNSYTASAAAAAGITCRLIRGPRLLHCKSLTVDSRIVWIGSGNFTAAAAHHNIEAYTRTDSADFAAQVLARWKGLP
jgi:phosphatidylserine/phosphatidylglycerophosphate/cardiolipin synthase-like enzyme